MIPNPIGSYSTTIGIRLYSEVLVPMALTWAVMKKFQVSESKALQITMESLDALDEDEDFNLSSCFKKHEPKNLVCQWCMTGINLFLQKTLVFILNNFFNKHR